MTTGNKSAVSKQCTALTDVLDRIGDKWTVLVVAALSHEALRFNALQRQVSGVSHRMLTLTLRGLERDGLVAREKSHSGSVSVTYSLTCKGRSLIPPLMELRRWALDNHDEIVESRRHFDRNSLHGK